MCDIELRKACAGDERILAYIQTESWKSAFSHILSAEELGKSTNIDKCEEMYKRVLANPLIHVTIEFVNEKAHCIAAWSRNRSNLGDHIAELICIHSLQDKWNKGYGSIMMHHILEQIQQEDYSEVILWVYEKNLRARKFYEKHGFHLSEIEKDSNGIIELMYIKTL